MIGKIALAKSLGWIAGYRRAHVHLGRSWLRRFFLALLIWCALIGSGIGFLWESANIFLHLTTGESLKIKTIGKWAAWNRIYKPEGRHE